MPRFTTASATRSSNAKSSVVSTWTSDVVEKAWESSARTFPHFSATDVLGKKSITVWKGRKIYNRMALYGGVEGESINVRRGAHKGQALTEYDQAVLRRSPSPNFLVKSSSAMP